MPISLRPKHMHARPFTQAICDSLAVRSTKRGRLHDQPMPKSMNTRQVITMRKVVTV